MPDAVFFFDFLAQFSNSTILSRGLCCELASLMARFVQSNPSSSIALLSRCDVGVVCSA
jgi:hypothetical protein